MKSDNAGTSATKVHMDATTLTIWGAPASSTAAALLKIMELRRKKYQYSDLDERPVKSPIRRKAEPTAEVKFTDAPMLKSSGGCPCNRSTSSNSDSGLCI
jgi:hypothetical protein